MARLAGLSEALYVGIVEIATTERAIQEDLSQTSTGTDGLPINETFLTILGRRIMPPTTDSLCFATLCIEIQTQTGVTGPDRLKGVQLLKKDGDHVYNCEYTLPTGDGIVF